MFAFTTVLYSKDVIGADTSPEKLGEQLQMHVAGTGISDLYCLCLFSQDRLCQPRDQVPHIHILEPCALDLFGQHTRCEN